MGAYGYLYGTQSLIVAADPVEAACSEGLHFSASLR